MDRRKKLVALGDPSLAEDAVETAETLEAPAETAPAAEELWLDESDEEPVTPRWAWVLPALAILTVAGWSGFFVWANRAEMLAGTAPQQWVYWIVDWAVPVLLVITTWLLVQRNSTREAARFGHTARMLGTESRALEQRLIAVNAELSLARDFIASQSRDLESLGRVASERLSANAEQLQQLIRDNGDQVNAIGQVSDTALANMDKLRDRLPVIANAARDVTSQIGHAGNTAQGQLDEMIAAFQRLNQFGEASGRQVESLRDTVNTTLAGFETRMADLDSRAQERFAALRERDEEFRLELEARETDALASLRRRATELAGELSALADAHRQAQDEAVAQLRDRMAELANGHDSNRERFDEAVAGMKARMVEALAEIGRIDESAIANARRRMQALAEAGERIDQTILASGATFDAEHERRRQAAAAAEAEALAAMQARLAAFDEQAAARHEAHVAHLGQMAERGETLAQRLAELDAEIARLAATGKREGAEMQERTAAFGESLSQSRTMLAESQTFLASLTDASVRLLELIRASAEHSEGSLVQSIGKADSKLTQFQDRAAEVASRMASAETSGQALAGHLETVSRQSTSSLETLETLDGRLAAIAAQSTSVAEKAAGDLQQALEALASASTSMIEEMRAGQADAVREIAARLGSEGSATIVAALEESTQEAIARLQDSAREASERGRATAAQLRDQLAKVNELASNLEQRVTQARAKAEEQVGNDFTRRMALITESLNSCSIDIARALDAEVTDTAWASYLRGDRGIFTRRAVRLLDNQEVRQVSEIYQADPELREAINRYIHDFEAMLRTVLSTRDGNALAVTLLSSDIGKLYVALAQAIERLRA